MTRAELATVQPKPLSPGARMYSALLRAFEEADDGVRLDFISALAAKDTYQALHRGVKKVVDQIARLGCGDNNDA